MSSMLEQAIVDAGALREAALQNAETLIIEKYASEVKEAVETLLEQPEDEDPLGDLGGEDAALGAPGEEAEEAPDEFVDQLPRADQEGEDTCPCPDDEQEVELDFDQLVQKMGEEPPAQGSEMTDRNVVAGELGLMEGDEPIDEAQIADLLTQIAEELEVDTQPVKSGWLETPAAEIAHAEELADAAAESSEEESELAEENENLKESIKRLENQISQISEDSNKFKQTILTLKEHLDESNLTNAKLLYTNRAIGDTSLNERQKSKIVETISTAQTPEEAKVIFETLQGAVGAGSSSRRRPKSLSEAVARRSSTVIRANKRESHSDQTTAVSDRWKTLAGIN